MTGETFTSGTGNCLVLTGQLADPYTGQTLTFSKAFERDGLAVVVAHVNRDWFSVVDDRVQGKPDASPSWPATRQRT